ncbi:MAG TPA: hypothetical protein VJN69_02005 [Candidatus Acidoferrales bacterium]|nr:hypothetical protein [Candidatus Acidoferrales bacterium]
MSGRPNLENEAVPHSPDLAQIETNAASIVDGVGAESVAVYVYLLREFGRAPVDTNLLYQFVFRSFYRLDNAGLTDKFKREYFRLMEEHRRIAGAIPLDALVKALYKFPGRNERKGIQFSFVTKLANTINPTYPIYDSEVAKVFAFRPPYPSRPFEDRLASYLAFYGNLRDTYNRILSENHIAQTRRMFREKYASVAAGVPELKVLDFIFWSAGKQERLAAKKS